MKMVKGIRPKGIIYQKELYIIVTSEKFFSQPVDSDIKLCEEIRKLTTGHNKDYTTRCLFNYDYIKNHYRQIAVNSKIQKELVTDPKAIQQMAVVGQNVNVNADGTQSMFVLTILDKIKTTQWTFYQGSVPVL